MGDLTPKDMYWMSRMYKKRVMDKALQDSVRDEDNYNTYRINEGIIPVVRPNGKNFDMDWREKPDVCGFPKGDSRRW
jgi:hypothetical protein